MKAVTLFSLFAAIFLFVYWRYVDTKDITKENKASDGSDIVGAKKTVPKIKTYRQYFDAVKKVCGELCDFEKEIIPEKIIGTVTANVDCDSLFNIDLIEPPRSVKLAKPPRLSEAPKMYKKYVSHFGKVELSDVYRDHTKMGSGSNKAKIFSKLEVEEYIDSWKKGTPKDNYQRGSYKTDEAAKLVNVTGKTILVIGSQTPWLEAVLLERNPKKVVTLEYGFFISKYPALEFIRPEQFRKRYHDRTLDKFDAIFTFSSMEHSGLGRYGDTLNPWGDVISIAQAWCVSTPDAKLAIKVPTNLTGIDQIEFNSNRMYGPVMWPFLVTNWVLDWTNEPEKNKEEQTYLIFKKQ